MGALTSRTQSHWLVLLLGIWLAAVTPGALADGPKAALTTCILTLDPEIDCPSCEDGIKRVLATAHGVDTVEIDVIKNRIKVRYDAARITVPALIGRVAVTGYTAKQVK